MQVHETQVRGDKERLISRTWPERRSGTDRRVLDTRIDLDPTSAWLGEMDRRHAERRQYSGAAVSGFGSLELESEVRS